MQPFNNLLNLINDLPDKSFDELYTKIKSVSHKIDIKYYDNLNLILLCLNNNSNLTSLERECRSVILDEKLNVICYSFDELYYNDEGKQFIVDNQSHYTYEECFEGTVIGLFYYKNQWNITTRRCLDARKSVWIDNLSYYDMFVDCVGELDSFFGSLDVNNYYYFVLVHHKNKNHIDYTKKLGEEYKKLIHIITRNNLTHLSVDDIPNTYTYKPEVDNLTMIDDLKGSELSEGYIVKTKINNKDIFIKLQTKQYINISTLLPNTKNLYQSFVQLYQTGNLKKHLEVYPNNNKIYNPIFDEQPYDTLGVIDATFKVLTSELYELFQLLWNYKDTTHKNNELYKILPKEYTTILYEIRGIHYAKKNNYILNKNNNTLDNTKNYNLRICDIYNLLKNYNSHKLIKLLSARKNLKTVCDNNNSHVHTLFKNTSNKCDKQSIKMTAILLNNMFK